MGGAAAQQPDGHRQNAGEPGCDRGAAHRTLPSLHRDHARRGRPHRPAGAASLLAFLQPIAARIAAGDSGRARSPKQSARKSRFSACAGDSRIGQLGAAGEAVAGGRCVMGPRRRPVPSCQADEAGRLAGRPAGQQHSILLLGEWRLGERVEQCSSTTYHRERPGSYWANPDPSPTRSRSVRTGSGSRTKVQIIGLPCATWRPARFSRSQPGTSPA